MRQSLDHVMNSLTSNARKIFMVLAQFHLDNIDQSSFLGISSFTPGFLIPEPQTSVAGSIGDRCLICRRVESVRRSIFSNSVSCSVVLP